MTRAFRQVQDCQKRAPSNTWVTLSKISVSCWWTRSFHWKQAEITCTATSWQWLGRGFCSIRSKVASQGPQLPHWKFQETYLLDKRKYELLSQSESKSVRKRQSSNSFLNSKILIRATSRPQIRYRFIARKVSLVKLNEFSKEYTRKRAASANSMKTVSSTRRLPKCKSLITFTTAVSRTLLSRFLTKWFLQILVLLRQP